MSKLSKERIEKICNGNIDTMRLTPLLIDMVEAISHKTNKQDVESMIGNHVVEYHREQLDAQPIVIATITESEFSFFYGSTPLEKVNEHLIKSQRKIIVNEGKCHYLMVRLNEDGSVMTKGEEPGADGRDGGPAGPQGEK